MTERAPAFVGRTEWLTVVAILAASLISLVYLAWRTGVTVDEPAHLLSSSLYWHGKDTLQPRDLPPLIKLVAGWVPALIGLPVPYDDHALMAKGHEWDIALEMMGRMNGEAIVRTFFFSRLPLLIFPAGCLLLLWWWSRRLFSPWVGVALAGLFALEPTAMGHGALFKNDLAATFAYLLFWYRCWSYWRLPSTSNAVWLGFSALLCLLAKMSLLLFAPLGLVVVVARQVASPDGMRRTIQAALLVTAIPYLGAIAACQGEAARLTFEDFQSYKAQGNLPRWPIYPAKVFTWLPVPRPLWDGAVNLIRSNESGSPVYLLGQQRSGGDRRYFLLALGVKSPLALLLLVLCGLVIVLARGCRGTLRTEDLFWIAPPLLYIGLASFSRLQLGIRLILPALPFGLLLAGAALDSLSERTRRVISVLTLAGTFVPVALVYPHCISFFNILTGLGENGIRYLSDSNLDWGQDLRQLANYCSARGIEKLNLSYFGTDNPFAYFSEQKLTLIPPPWNEQLAQGLIFRPKPGFYAISATLLTGHFFSDKYRCYYQIFRNAEPIARAGYSIFIYGIR